MRKNSVLLVVLSFIFCGTIFAAEGDVLWTRTYNDAANAGDYGYGIAVDGEGNVYVTGSEYVSPNDNIWVRKYDTNGYLVWTSTYNGADNGMDQGFGIAVDGSGNVYVTGRETVTGEGANIWVRKYDSDGDEVWTKTHTSASGNYDYGRGIAVDGNGNVYVTGYEYISGQEDNIWVRKYDSDGDVVWTKTYNGVANTGDRGCGIAVDGSGNVYVTGAETVAGEASNVWVRKYDSDGDVLWTRTYNGTDNDDDIGYGIAVDESGNVYVVGCEMTIAEAANIWVRKYDTDGDVVWTRTYNDIEDNDDLGQGIAVDGSGNVYVTGSEWVTGEQDNIWARKYDADGDIVWTKTHNGPINEKDRGRGIAVDDSGNVYVTGWVDQNGAKYDVWVRKYEGAFGEGFEPPTRGNVKIQGGRRGYVNPKRNEKAKIHFQPSGAGRVNVKIYTLRGLLVWEGTKSVSGVQDLIEWNGRNKENKVVASGIYVVYVEGPGIKATQKVAILK